MKLTDEEKQWIKDLCDELGIIRIEKGTNFKEISADDNKSSLHR